MEQWIKEAVADRRKMEAVAVHCPRCNSDDTKFCYYNNSSLLSSRRFCKTCNRYWTKAVALRHSAPVGGGPKKKMMKKNGRRSPPAAAVPSAGSGAVSDHGGTAIGSGGTGGHAPLWRGSTTGEFWGEFRRVAPPLQPDCLRACSGSQLLRTHGACDVSGGVGSYSGLEEITTGRLLFSLENLRLAASVDVGADQIVHNKYHRGDGGPW